MTGAGETHSVAKSFLAIIACANAAMAQTGPAPRFEDYPAAEIFTGTPANPRLVTTEERTFRTRIREGVSKGAGVLREGREQPGPNFAGHYIVITWACGSPCEMMAVVDARTGQIYYPPLSENNPEDQRLLLPSIIFPFIDDPHHALPLHSETEFRQNSELMIVKACPDPAKGWTNYTHYFLWRGNRWRLLSRVRLEKIEP